MGFSVFQRWSQCFFLQFQLFHSEFDCLEFNGIGLFLLRPCLCSLLRLLLSQTFSLIIYYLFGPHLPWEGLFFGIWHQVSLHLKIITEISWGYQWLIWTLANMAQWGISEVWRWSVNIIWCISHGISFLKVYLRVPKDSANCCNQVSAGQIPGSVFGQTCKEANAKDFPPFTSGVRINNLVKIV